MKKITLAFTLMCFFVFGCTKTPPEYYLLKLHIFEVKAQLNKVETDNEILKKEVKELKQANTQITNEILQNRTYINAIRFGDYNND